MTLKDFVVVKKRSFNRGIHESTKAASYPFRDLLMPRFVSPLRKNIPKRNRLSIRNPAFWSYFSSSSSSSIRFSCGAGRCFLGKLHHSSLPTLPNRKQICAGDDYD